MYTRDKKCVQFQLENLKGGVHLGDPGIHGRVILEWILKNQGVRVWTGFIWFRIGTSGRL
jgi:hypothetical protein